MHILIGIVLACGVFCLVLANDDARYLLGQLLKIVAGLAGIVAALFLVWLVLILQSGGRG